MSGKTKALLTALLIGGIARAVFLFFFFADLHSDPDAYRKIAVNLRTQGVYGQVFGDSDGEPGLTLQPTAFRPPLYPSLLSLMVVRDHAGQPGVSSLGIALLHWFLGVATIACAFFVGRNFGLAEIPCLVLSLMVALDPIGLRQSCLPMTETLATFLATAGIWFLSRPGPQKFTESKALASLAWGVCLGLFALCRPTFLIWGGMLLLMKLSRAIFGQASLRRARFQMSGLFLAGIVIALAPWTIRNYLVFGKPIFATTHGGYTIFLGNNDSFYDYLGSGRDSVWDGEAELKETVEAIRDTSRQRTPDGQGWIVDEVRKDQLYYQAAGEVIKRRPGDFALACWIRIVRFWSIIPKLPAAGNSQATGQGEQSVTPPTEKKTGGAKQRWIAAGSAAWYGTTFLLAIVGLVRSVWRTRISTESARTGLAQWLPALLLVIAFQGLHLVYWSNMRMRAPLVVVIALLAVMSWAVPARTQRDATDPLEN